MFASCKKRQQAQTQNIIIQKVIQKNSNRIEWEKFKFESQQQKLIAYIKLLFPECRIHFKIVSKLKTPLGSGFYKQSGDVWIFGDSMLWLRSLLFSEMKCVTANQTLVLQTIFILKNQYFNFPSLLLWESTKNS